jgi:myo-inositol 2-dehydrogenase/D-chiro-inositol 1-dehydrogenase
VIAVADPDEQARARALRLAPGAVACETLPELLAQPGLDAVVVATPTSLHAEHAVAVLEAGRHLYLEKPLAVRLDDGRRVLDAARAAGVVATVGFNRRRHPLLQRVRSLVAAGELGRVALAQTCFAEPMERSGWRAADDGGGPLLDLASHHVDLLRWLLADEAAWADGVTAGDGLTGTVRIGFARGTLAEIAASFAAGRTDTYVLHGERGTLSLDRYARSLRLTRAAPRYAVRGRRVRGTAADPRWRPRALLRPASDPSYAATIAAWVGALNGGEDDLPNVEDGLRSLEIIAAAGGQARTVFA